MYRIISIILLIGLISFDHVRAEEKSVEEEKPVSPNKEATPSELPLLSLNDDVLGETLPPISSPIPSSVKPSSPFPEKELLTTIQPSMISPSFGPSSIQPLKPSSTESSLSNLLTGEEDSENTSDEEMDSKLPPTRKLITFDQRQEGQYNIRADLDNFMIVVIPPNPSAGISLLDLLTRSSSKRANTKKSNKKHYLYGSEIYDTKPSHFTSERSKHNPHHMSYLNKILQSHQNPNNIGISGFLNSNNIANSNQISDYVEGRTPYRVDISSNIASSELNSEKLYQNSANDGTDSQIDVIPPPYPISYQHLMKPYHLEIEPHVVQIPIQHSTAHAIPPQVPTNIYNPSSIAIQQQQQQQSTPLQHNNLSQKQHQQQQHNQHKKQDQNQRSFLNGNFNPASVARGNFLDFFTRFTNGVGIPGSTSVFLPNSNPRTIYPSASTNTNNVNGITATSSSYFNNDNNNNNNNNNIGRRYAKSIRDSFIYSPADPDIDIIQFNNILRGDGGNNIYSNYMNKHDSTVIKRDIPTSYNNNNNNNNYPTYFGIKLNSNDATLYPPISYHRIIFNNNPPNIYGKNNNNYGSNNNNDDDDDNDDNSIYDLQQNNNIEETIKHSDFIENDSNGFNSDVELKLIGATEQCGPDSVRDSYGICRLLSNI